MFSEDELKDVFNGRFWASKKNFISEQELYETWAECTEYPEYFDFSENTSDQPIFNYMVLKRIKRRINLVRTPIKRAGNWAGSTHYQRQGNILIDPNLQQNLKYLHWAGIYIEPDCPYWDIWQYYRHLNSPKLDC